MRLSFLLMLLLWARCFAADAEQIGLADILYPEENQYNPTYMTRHISHFGSYQSDYLKRSRDLIAKTKKGIQEAVKSKQNLSVLFSDLLSSLGQERNQIALDHHTPAADEFGARRDLRGISDLSYTYFARGYQEYGDRLLVFLKDILSQMPHNATHFIQKKYSKAKTCLGYVSSIELEVLEKEDLKKLNWLRPFENIAIPDYLPLELLNKKDTLPDEKVRLFQALERLRKESPEIHEKVTRSSLLMEVQRDCPSPIKIGPSEELATWVGNPAFYKSAYVLATVFFQINGKQFPLYQYLTWLYRDPENPGEDLLERMVHNSVVTVVHQYHWNLPEMLQEVATFFKQVIEWDRQDLFELKKRMALFRYGFACMPFARGTAAITEWLEAALYDYHEVQFQCDKERMVDLEAYVHPFFSDFLEAYNSMYSLSKI